MNTLLFVFTTDGGGAREDASVYYSQYLLVAGEESDRSKIAESIASKVGGQLDSWGTVTHSRDAYPDADFDPQALVTELALDGWQARWAKTTMVVEQ